MTTKRTATTELNHDNWNEEEEPEEAGTFTRANEDVLKRRVIKTAKRRLPNKDEGSKSVFGGFTGFKMATASSTSPFSFLSNTSTAKSQTTTTLPSDTNIAKTSVKSPENGTSKVHDTPQSKSHVSEGDKNESKQQDVNNSKNSEYFAKLKGLNESVAQWIKSHVDANPFCILTPIFKDYERYLKEIESKHENQSEKLQDSNEEVKTGISKEKDGDAVKNEAVTKSESVKPFGTSEWKSEIFQNVSSNTKSIFEQKTDSSKSIFGNADQLNAQKSIFGAETKTDNKSISDKSPFSIKPISSSENKEDDKESKPSTGVSFVPTNTATFSFGQSSTTSNVSASFSFGSAKPFTFGAQVVKPQDNEEKSENEPRDEDDEEPPKPDFKPVTEEGAIYEQRCKVFIKKDGVFGDRGIGMLFLKPTPNEKMQLIVRAENSLGNLLLNTWLTESVPTQRMNKNTIMLVCLPDAQSPPTPVLLRVKTSEAADDLFETLNKHKK